MESFPGVVFHDSQNQVCVRDPATAEHIVVDEEGVVFVYSDDERFRRAFVETGFDERIEPLISEEGRWNYTPPDSAVAQRLFIDQLRLEPVEMDLFMRVRQILSEYPRVSISDGSDWLKVHAADASGFSVWLSKSSSGFTVSFDGWHEEFSARRDALDCFLFGLSPSCRLHVTLRGTVPTKWRAEALSDGEWVATSSTGLFLQPFWRRVRIEYRQNQFLAPSTPEAVIRFRNLIAKSYS